MRIPAPMRPHDEAIVTIEPSAVGPAGGVWTIVDGAPIIVDAAGPATLLVPAEAVLLLGVDLPLPNRAKRLAALPFAIEDRIADPVDAVHLALGDPIGEKRYLVGVVRHAVMADWLALAEAAGIADAAFLPDALALPQPVGEGWCVDLNGDRALVRAADGTGFAVPRTMLVAAWEAAGRPAAQAIGEPLPDAMAGQGDSLPPLPLAQRVTDAPIDLRQGAYARRRAAWPSTARKVAMILGIAAVAHTVIAVGDTMMLRAIADRRQEALQQLVVQTAPNVPTGGDDFVTRVADLLPRPTGTNRFVPLLARVSGALAPIAPTIVVRTMTFEGNALIIDLDSPETGIADRLRAALSAGGVAAQVAPAPAGGLRITARGA